MSEPEDGLPTVDQARVEARPAHLAYMMVLTSQHDPGRHLPGLPLANVLFNARERGWDQSFDVALATLVGFRLGALSGPVASTEAFVDSVSAYLASFKAEFRRIESGYRAGGQERDAMHAYVMAEPDKAQVFVWLEAFATADLPSGWERGLRDAAERDKQAERAAKRSNGGSWLPSAFRRRDG